MSTSGRSGSGEPLGADERSSGGHKQDTDWQLLPAHHGSAASAPVYILTAGWSQKRRRHLQHGYCESVKPFSTSSYFRTVNIANFKMFNIGSDVNWLHSLEACEGEKKHGKTTIHSYQIRILNGHFRFSFLALQCRELQILGIFEQSPDFIYAKEEPNKKRNVICLIFLFCYTSFYPIILLLW